MLTEKQKYRNWLEAQIKDHGLVSVSVCPARDPLGPDVTTDELRFGTNEEEEFYKELNAMNAAVARGDFRIVTDL